jgi:hypothetical protein
MGETYLSLAKRNTIFNHLIRENKKPLTITKKISSEVSTTLTGPPA